MARLFKILLVLGAGLLGVVVIASVALFLFFDPNDFRERISAGVKEATGRDLVIAGDIKLTLFPWLAVEVGRTELGNAPGFGDDKFLSFDSARLSVRMLPLIFSQQVEVGTATLDGLNVNLEVARNGSNNWQDLADGGDDSSAASDTADDSDTTVFDVANVRVSDANVSYTDAASGSKYVISNLSFETGRIAIDTPVDMNAEFDFQSIPGDLGGHLAIRGTTTITAGARLVSVDGLNVAGTLRGIVAEPTEFNFDSRALRVDTVAESIDAGELDLSILGLSMAAKVEPFSYAGTPKPVAELTVATFSLKDLMKTLDIEAPVTADPKAMQRVSFKAKAALGENDLSFSAMTLELDDSTMTGTMSVPTGDSGTLKFNLGVDAITLDRYMAPAADTATAGNTSSDDVEIPVDLIRTLNVNGTFRIARATMTGMEFSNVQLGVNGTGGKLRLNPLSADFYDGKYAGDVRVDASRDLPSISVNEKISGVNLGAMMKAMYDTNNVTGTINGSFALGGAGRNVSAIRKDLDGTITVELLDGAWEGVDVWHKLRTARALYRQQPAPEPVLPARTKFSSVKATGIVTDGVYSNDDFLAELPFLRLSGRGQVDLNTTEVNYALEVRVLERPEFMAGATAAEVSDFTKTVVPLKITGPLSAPTVRPDIEGIFRGQVQEALEEKKQELKDQVLNRLLGGSKPPAQPQAGSQAEPQPGSSSDPQAEPPAEGAEAPTEEPPPEEDLEEQLKKDLLKKIFQR